MSPKEKAVELYWKYYQLVADCSHPEEKAKECALIVVDEIIQSNPTEINEKFYLKPYTSEYMESSINYWNEVKQEIEKL
jgi:hypothetical protein